MSTENFTRALQITHSFDPSVSAKDRLAAEHYLMNLKESGEGLNLSFHIITNEPLNEIRCFWAFNTVIHHLPQLAYTLDDTQAEELYRTLFAFIHRCFFLSPSLPPPDYLINKHAQMMVVGLQEFYPRRWSQCFDDVLSMLEQPLALSQPATTGSMATMYMLRIFECVDERVVCVRDRQERGKQQRARDMELKDAMRRQVIPRVVPVWYRILSESRQSLAEAAKLCLSVVETYIEWVDVAHFMNPDWINLLYFLLTMPPLRIAACECLLSLVEKKQLPGIKMQSLATLSVVDSLPRMLSLFEVPPTSEESAAFIDTVARFAVAVADQLKCLVEMLSAQLGGPMGGSGGAGVPGSSSSVAPMISSIDVDGILIEDVAFDITPALVQNLSGALHSTMSCVMQILRLNLFDVREDVLPFLQVYLKTALVSQNEMVDLLGIIFDQTRVYNVEADEDRIWQDSVIDQRKVLHNLLRLMHRRQPELVLQHIEMLMSTVLEKVQADGLQFSSGIGMPNGRPNQVNGSSIGAAFGEENDWSCCGRPPVQADNINTPEVVEAVLRYVFIIGESIKLECLKEPENLFTRLMERLITMPAIVEGPATCVHLAFFELLDRYYLFFVYRPEYIPLLLQRLLLQQCGVVNPSDRVRARICYLFSHLLQVLKSSLSAYVDDMTQALHSIVTTTPQLVPSDRRGLYESIGILIASLPDVDDITQALSANNTGSNNNNSNAEGDKKVQLVCMVVDSALQYLQSTSAACMQGGLSSLNASAASEHPVADAISYLTALAKGLGNNTSTSSSSGGPSGGSRASGASTNDSFAAQSVGGAGGLTASALAIAQRFMEVTEQVRSVTHVWRASAAVRDGTTQYFHQLLNLVPIDVAASCFESYLLSSLAWMQAVPELGRLLRLMYQYVNKAGTRGVGSVARLLPPLWEWLRSVGELSAAAPVVCMGVLSDTAREQVNVYRHFFSFLYNTAAWGCAASLMAVPKECLEGILEQLRYALSLPTELELPKAALQVFEKICSDLNNSVSAQLAEQNPQGLDMALVQRHAALFADFLLHQAIPSALAMLCGPSFDLNDAKSHLIAGEVAQLLKASMTSYGDAATNAIFTRLQEVVGLEVEVRAFVVALRDVPRVNSQAKSNFRELINIAKSRQK